MNQKTTSLRTGFLWMIVLCWLVPIVIGMSLAVFLLGKSYQQSAEKALDASAQYAIRQVQLQLEEAIYDSKGVSYDGEIRSAYRDYQEHGDRTDLYRTTNNYLTQKFSRKPQYMAVFLSYWDSQVDSDVYLLSNGVTSSGLLQECREAVPRIFGTMKTADTQIRFLNLGGRLYLARNLLDSHFEPYAFLVMMLDPQRIFEPLTAMSRIQESQLTVDDLTFTLAENGMLGQQNTALLAGADVCYPAELDGHTLSYTANLSEYNLLGENPWILGLASAVALMVVPLLIVVVSLFRRHVTSPMETLAEAHQLVQSGNRGYEIGAASPNMEFGKLYTQFNAMSKELKNQFERSYLEQQASQRAQIKALQSQINPHFLNNTLEIINWEARLAGNDRISAMIEALSTMLGAALDRNGRPQIPLKEELGYVDAYLYIIQERIGSGFHVYKEIDPEVLPMQIPRLILQPIVENAVEHDITARHGGNLWVRAGQEQGRVILEVEHDGTMTDADREKVRLLLADQMPGTRVGLQNVSQRLKLIYGARGNLQIEETEQGTILVRIRLPSDAEQPSERRLP